MESPPTNGIPGSGADRSVRARAPTSDAGLPGWTLEVFPDAARVEEALVARAESLGVVDARRFITWAQLVERLTEGVALRWVGRMESEAVLAGCVVDEPRAVRGGDVGRIGELMEALFELQAAGVGSGTLARAARAAPHGGAHLEKLAGLLARYRERMSALGWADREQRLEAALRAVRASLPPSLAGCSRVRVVALHDFPPLRQELLVALALRLEDAGARLELSLPGTGGAGTDAFLVPLLQKLERDCQQASGFEVEVALPSVGSASSPPSGGPYVELAAALFEPGASSASSRASSPDIAPDASVESPLLDTAPSIPLVEAASPEREAAAAAEAVVRLLRGGAAPDEVVVTYRTRDESVDRLVAHLSERGVPVAERRGVPLVRSRPFKVARALLRMIDDALPAAAVARCLDEPLLPGLRTGSRLRPSTALRWAGARGGEVGGRIGAVRARLESLWRRLQHNEDREAPAVGALLQDVVRLEALCDALPREAEARELVEGFARLLERAAPRRPGDALPGLGSPDRLVHPRGATLWRAAAEDVAALNGLEALFADMATVFETAGGRLDRDGLLAWMERWAADVPLPATGPVGAVSLLPVRELPGRRYRHLLVLGMRDGGFPARPAPEALLDDDARRTVCELVGSPVLSSRAGDDAARAPRWLAEDRLLFALALAGAEESVHLFRSRSGSDGRPTSASAFIEALEQHAVVLRIADEGGPVPPLEAATTETQLRRRVALESFGRRSPAHGSIGQRGQRGQRGQDGQDGQDRTDGEAAALARLFEEEGAGWQGLRERTAMEHERILFFGDEERPPGPFTGAISTPVLRAALEERLGGTRERPLSASALESFGDCAYKGFLERLLKLRGDPELTEEVGPLGLGNLLHRALELLVPKLNARGALSGGAETLWGADLDAALDQAAHEQEISEGLGHPAVWEARRRRARRELATLLREGVLAPSPGFTPWQLEQLFGGEEEGSWGPVAVPGPGGTEPLFLRGKADRVDRAADGTLEVIDYKSGRVDGLRDSLLRWSFQLPIYLHAAQVTGAGSPRDASLLSLRDGKRARLGDVLKEGETLETLLTHVPGLPTRPRGEAGANGTQRELDEARDDEGQANKKQDKGAEAARNLPQAIHALVGSLREGRFPMRGHHCERCELVAVCRRSDRTVSAEEGGA